MKGEGGVEKSYQRKKNNGKKMEADIHDGRQRQKAQRHKRPSKMGQGEESTLQGGFGGGKKGKNKNRRKRQTR